MRAFLFCTSLLIFCLADGVAGPANPELTPPDPRPQGHALHEPWSMLRLEGRPDEVYVLRRDIPERQVPIRAALQAFPLFKRFATQPEGNHYLPIGRDEFSETFADKACEVFKSPGKSPGDAVKIPTLSPLELEKEFPGESKIPEPGLFATIQLPYLDHPQVASLIVDCRDPAKRRFELAQQRAAYVHALYWQSILEKKLAEHLARISQDEKSDALRLSLLKRRIETLTLKSKHVQASQLRAYRTWLDSTDARFTLDKDQRAALKGKTLQVLTELDRSSRGRKPHPTETYFEEADFHFIEYAFKR